VVGWVGDQVVFPARPPMPVPAGAYYFGPTDTVEAGDTTRADQGMWSQDVTLIVGLVDTVSMPALLKMVAGGCIPAEKTGTHWFTFARMGEACDVLSNAAGSSTLKVVITPS
jgi:threonine dehydrogenase-like Zn-dependent dehydrogenase